MQKQQEMYQQQIQQQLQPQLDSSNNDVINYGGEGVINHLLEENSRAGVIYRKLITRLTL